MQNFKRDISLDNAKGLLIILVVFAHTIESITTTTTYVSAIHAIIYSFHMPAFIFISGYLSKNDERAYKNSVSSCLIPFMVLNIAYSFFKGNINFLMPGPALWYFLCLFYWRVLIGTLKKVKCLLPISIIIALFVGFIPDVNSFMGLSRAICFFPFFLMGYFCDQTHVERISRIPKWLFGLIFIATILLSVTIKLYLFPDLSYALKDPYDLTQFVGLVDLAKRLILFWIFFVATACFLYIMKAFNKEGIITWLGKRTVSVYALHIFVVHGFFMILKRIAHVNLAEIEWGGCYSTFNYIDNNSCLWSRQ